MAKRKRLTPLGAIAPLPGPAPVRAPIADVSGEAAARAALAQVEREIAAARGEGRMVLKLPLDAIDADYLLRDRMKGQSGGGEDMEALRASLRARGQQSPVEVVQTAEGYGLISGWRRLTALRDLAVEDPARFGTIEALLRRPEDRAGAYVAMVEENEIRADLSFYERARVVLRTLEAGIFETEREALRTLFAAASDAKRSKVKSFLPLVRSLDGALHHPAAIPERLGLALSKRLTEKSEAATALIAALAAADDPAPETERALLEHFVSASVARQTFLQCVSGIFAA